MTDNQKLASFFKAFLIVFYIAIVSYVCLAVFHINTLPNFLPAAIFEVIGFVILSITVFCAERNYFEIAFYIITGCYTIALNVLTMVFCSKLTLSIFVLSNLILLFVFFILTFIFIMWGRS